MLKIMNNDLMLSALIVMAAALGLLLVGCLVI